MWHGNLSFYHVFFKVSCFKNSPSVHSSLAALGSASLLVNIVSNSRTTLGTKSLLKTYMQFSWATKLQSLEAAGRSSIANQMTIFLSITQITGALVFLVCGSCICFYGSNRILLSYGLMFAICRYAQSAVSLCR